MRFLVTAGNTREMIDRVRDWGNIFTGNTGYAIAQELSKLVDVDLLTSNPEHRREITNKPGELRVHGFTTHAELKEQLELCMRSEKYDAIFMTAAVADYHPSGAYSVLFRQVQPDGSENWTVRPVQAGKIKSTYHELAFLGTPTEKLVDLFRSKWGYTGLLVKFKLEVGISEDELKRIAEQSRIASGADFIVANTLDMVHGERAGAWLLGEAFAERIERAKLPARLAQLAIKGRP
ncbi:MAG TPA: phosphopantothenoylcysteine decarboxylase [Tepidisphaeraceae bacterium]|jgi:phosphopantothenoylcysteine synthetase/decarboxylase